MFKRIELPMISYFDLSFLDLCARDVQLTVAFTTRTISTMFTWKYIESPYKVKKVTIDRVE